MSSVVADEEPGLSEGARALQQSVELSEGRLDGAARDAGAALSAKVDGRSVAGMGVTVVALAGSTGSGKSSLFNRLAGRELAQVSPLRPTTDRALAVAGTHPPRSLVQWLSVGQWSVLPGQAPLGEESVVLVDLPDFDSTEAANRVEAERLISKADLVVWVVDPQKYGDGVLHLDFLRSLSEHATGMVVALNQVDLLTPEDGARVKADLRRLLDAEGFAAPVIAVSARTGEGVADLSAAISRLASKRAAAALRLEADLRTQGHLWADAVADEGGSLHATPPPSFTASARELVAYSSAAAVVGAAKASYLHRGAQATGWLPLRWLRSLRPDPLRRLHLSQGTSAASASSSLRPDSAATGARMVVRRYADAAAAPLPAQWKHRVLHKAQQDGVAWLDQSDLVDADERKLLNVKPAWWSAVNLLQWVLALATLVGLAWLAALWIAPALRVALPEPPYWGPLGWPTWLLAGGALLGILLAALSRLLLRGGANALQRRVQRRLSHRVEEQARTQILPALEEELGRYASFVAAVQELQRVGSR